MHVLFLPSWYPENPEDIRGSFFREQALALLKAGCKVGVIAPEMLSLRRPLHALDANHSISEEIDSGMPTYRKAAINWTPRCWALNARRMGRIGVTLYKAYFAEHGRPDVIHVHASLLGGAAAIAIAKYANIPYAISEHSSLYARGLVPKAGIMIARSVSTNAGARFAVSKPFAKLLERRLELASDSFAVMPNIVDQSFLDVPLPLRDTCKTRFLHISLLNSEKRVDLIVRAFAQQFSQNPEVTLTIGGDGPTRSTLMSLATELGVADRVYFLGGLSRSEVRSAMANSDAFVLSSKYETFGVVLIEALAMGLPIIATECGGPEDIVTPNAGILVPTDNVDAMASAMEQICDNRNRWSAKNLRADCAARFGPDAISRRWIAHYDHLLESGGLAT
ncbi:glycosyltransferase [Sulfitobacter pontiacus]|uniref:glycosyltransferase n=1 Tax=Sulfitobacter pontiacus TaxID=60137 RepID=UPI0015E034E1|nr:glycosyltransferase [Sulfitobacter pontiacus]QLL44315.1 glycosyltransferase family 4 protein [Sulfitobacter pontiacus]